MDDTAPLAQAVGRILKVKFEEMQRAINAVRITRIEATSPTTALIVFGDGSTHTLTMPEGPRGEPGARGERGERGEPGVGELGQRGERGERGEPGERGADGIGIDGVVQDEDAPQGFTLRMTNGDEVDVQLPAGPPGERGEQGEPGRDRFIVAPRKVMAGERVEKNDLIHWNGGILQCLRSTSATPDDDPASFSCLVAGIESLAMVENVETRTYDLTARFTNGDEQVMRMRAMPRLMADGPRPGERVIKGDQIVKGDWLYTATQDAADPVNTEAGWRRQYLRGKRGDTGPRGEQGVPGVGIADVSVNGEGILTVSLTSGEEKVAALVVREAA
jgi:hypothetical protein